MWYVTKIHAYIKITSHISIFSIGDAATAAASATVVIVPHQIEKLEFLLSLTPAEMNEIQRDGHRYPEWVPYFLGGRADTPAEQQRRLLRNAYRGAPRLTESEVEVRVKKEAAIRILMGAIPPVPWSWSEVLVVSALPSEGGGAWGQCRCSWPTAKTRAPPPPPPPVHRRTATNMFRKSRTR